jgi:hypothetical protein
MGQFNLLVIEDILLGIVLAEMLLNLFFFVSDAPDK